MPPDLKLKRHRCVRRGKRRRHVAVTFADHGRLGGMAGGEFDRRRIGGHDFRQIVDLDCHQIGGVFGGVGVGREHDRDRLTDIAHAPAGEDRLTIGFEPLDAGEPEVDRRDIGNVGRGPYRDHSGARLRSRGFDRDDTAMCTRGADHAHIDLVRKRNIRRKAALAADQGSVLQSRHRTADERRGHGGQLRLDDCVIAHHGPRQRPRDAGLH